MCLVQGTEWRGGGHGGVVVPSVTAHGGVCLSTMLQSTQGCMTCRCTTLGGGLGGSVLHPCTAPGTT